MSITVVKLICGELARGLSLLFILRFNLYVFLLLTFILLFLEFLKLGLELIDGFLLVIALDLQELFVGWLLLCKHR